MKKQLLLLFTMFLLISGCGTQQTDNETATKENATIQEESDSTRNAGEEDEEKDGMEETASRSADDQSGTQEERAADEESNSEENLHDDPDDKLRVHYIDVGQADASLLEFGSYRILIDAGNWNSDDVVQYLHDQNVEKLDIVIGTHPDADHIGQMDQVINQFEVEEVWLSGNTSTSDTFTRLIEAIESSGAAYEEPRAGDVYDIGPLEINVLYPDTITGKTNQESISLKLSYGETEFIFTGDAETEQEREMIESGTDLDADILQLGHHGSDTSTSKAFLKAVTPEVAVYSAGADNPYGHPASEVIQRIGKLGAKLYGTDIHGTVIVETNGEEYQVTTKKDGNISPGSSEPENGESEQQTEEATSGQCVDINNASSEDLQEIIHIGPARAEDLIDLRPYDSVDDLSRIDGIGPVRMADIKAEEIACIGG
ncbi:MBL fold metallo-hydrolase [Sediminibacillus massiliensis]|uniref:MBL fold metallo-hydrolase n=1 Tax=Sediminibacillus massiliensis TaxID=1926277 RepID=UPI001FEA4DBB|nr:MBL fold metallo-hydrolase [Sediminibacillus massiliensis]